MKGNSKNIIITGAIIVAIVVAGYFYFKRDQSSGAVLTSQDSSSVAKPVDSELLTALNSLKQHNLDASIFSSAAWLSLHDFGKTLAPQQPFRPNPFAPLDSSAFASATATTATR